MTHVAPPSAESCVWMTAGLVRYKLCDRDFDCEHCPLDVALRGGAPAPAGGTFVPGPIRHGEGFPSDRAYTAGHTWVARDLGPGDRTVRVGLDSFAAALLPPPLGVRSIQEGGELAPGEAICDIELPDGIISIGAPIRGRLRCLNPALGERPGLVVEWPYDDGWLVEMVPAEEGAGPEGPLDPDGLLDAAEARERTTLDLRRFRRRIALHLLADVAPVGPCLADGGEPLTSLYEILGARRYLQTLREILR